ncbi:MAG: N-acetyl-gamma-glutamyl-phosphate reductase [Candidatus Bathyarchaeota archaeon]
MKIAIIGGSGYAGGELLRLLLHHPEAEITQVTSNRFADEFIYTIHPNLRGHTLIKFSPYNPEKIIETCDTIFMATPHGVSKDTALPFIESGLKIIDLSADYRLKDPADYPTWYGWEHPHPELLEKYVFGLPELHRAEIKGSQLVACSGCMAGASILALAPVVKAGLVDSSKIIIDAKIGSSGGGSEPTLANHHSEKFGGLRPYQVTGHRHIAEIEQEVAGASGAPVSVGFTPHSLDISRGILVTAHFWLNQEVEDKDIWKAYRGMYDDEPFIRFVKSKKGLHQLPDPKNVLGTNFCDIGFMIDDHVNRLVSFSSIDNIVKGAAGQAVQCFNIQNGFDEKTGINLIGFH